MDKLTKILIIDDSELMRMKLYHILLNKYAEENLFFADSIEKAWEKILKNSIDLILLDIYMPGENGADFINDILKNNRLKDIPIIVITGTSKNSFIKTFFAEHIQAYLHKPIDKASLLNSIKEALS
jgi:CheY-like chemotaxis protein